jgi:transcriptional regulator with XRE-family HTH domain
MSTTRTPFPQKVARARFERMAAEHKKAVGRKIAELREEQGWSQPELAAKIPAPEVDAQQVSKWERGIHTPRKHITALAKALGVEEGEILSGKPTNEAAGGDLMESLNGAAEGRLLERLSKKLDLVLDQQARLLAIVSEVRSEQEDQRRLRGQSERGEEGSGK